MIYDRLCDKLVVIGYGNHGDVDPGEKLGKIHVSLSLCSREESVSCVFLVCSSRKDKSS